MNNSINDLPVEILIDIMRYLDQGSLKAAVLTCQRWKKIIEKYCFWPIRLYDGDLSYRTVRALQETSRKLHFKLTVHHKFTNEIQIDIYKQIGWAVTKLIYNFEGHSTCFEYLKYFPNLEHIQLNNLEAPTMPNDCGVLDLKKLKSLKTNNCCHNIYKYFGASNIKSLLISEMSVTSQCVVNFIRRQKSLTKLTLQFVNDGGTFFQQLCHTTPDGTVPFKLAHLSIFDENPPNNFIGLDTFLKMQSETLKKLGLRVEFSYSIFEIIFEELKNLKFLTIEMPAEIEFGENLQENLSIENLSLQEIKLSPLALHHFCKRLPNVRNLYFDAGFNVDQLQIVSTALNMVTTLYVDEFDDNFEAVKFPNLTSIFIETLLVGDLDWTAFCKANSRITEMVIQQCLCDLKLKQIKMITRNLKLKTLKIGRGFSTDERFLSIICKQCPKLKVLELHESCGIKDLDYTVHRFSAIPLQLCDAIEIPNEIRFC